MERQGYVRRWLAQTLLDNKAYWQYSVPFIIAFGILGFLFQWKIQGLEFAVSEVWVLALGTLGPAMFVGILFFLVHAIRAPAKLAQEDDKTIKGLSSKLSLLTDKRFVVSLAEPYEDASEQYWLRLQVENPTALPIPNCYGRCIDYRFLCNTMTNKDKEVRDDLSPAQGRRSMENQELPPPGHRFPWFPTGKSDTTIVIPGHGGYEFLHVVVTMKWAGCFYTPTKLGAEYPNYSTGNFEVTLEIGSESEAFKPTKVKFVFSAEGEIRAKSLVVLN